MDPSDYATTAAEAVRGLNRDTLFEGYSDAPAVYDVAGELQLVLQRLPQALTQAARDVRRHADAGRVYDDRAGGMSADGAAGLARQTAAEAAAALERAAALLTGPREALQSGLEALAHLGAIREHQPE